MQVLVRRTVTCRLAMLVLCGTATWTMAEEPSPSDPSPSLTTLRNFLRISQEGSPFQPINLQSPKPTPMTSDGLKVIPPDVSRSSVKLVEHIVPVPVTDNIPAGSVPTPSWSKPLPVPRSIVTVR